MVIPSAAGARMRLRAHPALNPYSRTSIQSHVTWVPTAAPRNYWPGTMGVARSPTCLAVASLRPFSSGVCHRTSLQSRARPQYAARRSRRLTVLPKAMVNVDFASPSLVLGAILIGCGIALLQMRNMQTSVSRDADIVVAAMVSIVGSTLIFQGWRLDPLLLLCQALTTSVAVWYGIETFRLRSREETLDQQQGEGDWGPYGPPGASDTPSNMLPAQQQQQQQQGGLNRIMGTFMGSKQAAQPQQQQQAGVYGQRGGSPGPGGYLPPAQEQQGYPWVERQQSPVMQYSQQYGPEPEAVQQSVQQGDWPYGQSTSGQYNAASGAVYNNSNAYYDQASGQYYEYPQRQEEYVAYSQQGGAGAMLGDAVQGQYNQGAGYASPQQPAGLPLPSDMDSSSQYGVPLTSTPSQYEQYPEGASSSYGGDVVSGSGTGGPSQAESQAKDASTSGAAGPKTRAPVRHMVVEKVDDWE